MTGWKWGFDSIPINGVSSMVIRFHIGNFFFILACSIDLMTQNSMDLSLVRMEKNYATKREDRETCEKYEETH